MRDEYTFPYEWEEDVRPVCMNCKHFGEYILTSDGIEYHSCEIDAFRAQDYHAITFVSCSSSCTDFLDGYEISEEIMDELQDQYDEMQARRISR